LHKTIKKVTEDIELMKFNTAISAMMEFTNAWQIAEATMSTADLADFLKILSPFAPHLSEELWQAAGFKGMIFSQKWPKYNQKLIDEEKILLIIQVNGKVRDKIPANTGDSQKEAEKLAMKSQKVKKFLEGKEIKKVIFVPDKLINIVV